MVAQCSEAAQGHENNGVEHGAEVYKTLWDMTYKAMGEYIAISGEQPKVVMSKLPSLLVLSKLSNPTVEDNRDVAKRVAPMAAAGLFVAFAISTIIGLSIGWGISMSHVISHLMGR